jgi:hypothetical protein
MNSVSSVPPTVEEIERDRFCNACNCAVGLHDDEEGCKCADHPGHSQTLRIVDDDQYCACKITGAELIGRWFELTRAAPE